MPEGLTCVLLHEIDRDPEAVRWFIGQTPTGLIVCDATEVSQETPHAERFCSHSAVRSDTSQKWGGEG